MPWVLGAVGVAYVLSRLRASRMAGGAGGGGLGILGGRLGGGPGDTGDEGGGGDAGETAADFLSGGVNALPATGNTQRIAAALASGSTPSVIGGRRVERRPRDVQRVAAATVEPSRTRGDRTSVGIETPSFGRPSAPRGGKGPTELAPEVQEQRAARGTRTQRRQEQSGRASAYANIAEQNRADIVRQLETDTSPQRTRGVGGHVAPSPATTPEIHRTRGVGGLLTSHDSTRSDDTSNRRQSDRRTVAAAKSQASSVVARLGR
jgi:hypothetical protein